MPERQQMKGVEKQAPEMAGLVYWDYPESRDVITRDGKNIGVVRGFLIDTDWKIPNLVVEVRREILDEAGIEQKHKIINVALVNLPTSYIDVASDVVQLNTDLASLKGKVQPYEVRR